MDPIALFERAARHAAALARSVRPEQLGLPTPCTEWDVAALLGHMAGGPAYLLGSMGRGAGPGPAWPDEAVIDACLDALRAPGALERRCPSPAGFEWSVAEAAAGTAMDQLVHGWDLAVAIGEDRTMDPAVTEAIVAMFLPQMPQVGRQAGLVGPAVAVAPGASTQDRLLAAMGRDPGR
jgi:uncharacterized protein (TIGR03086 family)